ncbi:MAG TPA: hypothetical protein VEW93_11195 [Acidimicrobiales bacterium]|nr:hypothetical protein [Acidimicrobiales bacterium]
MSVLTTDAPSPDHADGETGTAGPHLGWAVAGLSAGAAAIHFAMVPGHADGSLVDPIGFAVVGWFQLLVAAAIMADRAGRNLYRVAVVGNLAVLGLWLWSRTAGLPVGSHSGTAEDFGTVDGITALLEVGVILVAARILLAPAGQRVARGRIAPVLAAVAALGLATTAITSTDAAEHGGADHGHGEEAAAGHAHGEDPAAHTTLMTEIDQSRCDEGFNIPAYWEETSYLGIDTYQGGAMAGDEHAHDSAGATAEPDPTEGKGSPDLDRLVGLTTLASGGEIAAAQLVAALGEVDDETYDAWLWWLRSSGTVGGSHEHAASAAPGDSGGHGGHAGPQPWAAMTDPAQCAQLEDEIDLARETALRHPTAADAVEAGYMRVTPYVAGIAAHYMNFDLVDGTFDIEGPEMLLYDGNEPDAHIVGLSYYINQEGTAEPTQGFTGANDHYHRHVGLCVGAGGVIGDSTTTEEDCAARGGTKANGSKGWMAHAWVVPGCESPWGVFSAASPTLDGALPEESGQNDGGCSASGVRQRYDMGEALATEPISNDGG